MSNPAYFDKLYGLVCQHPISQAHLRALKGQCKSEIKSVRRLDAISSLRDLLGVLRKRACIDGDNYEVLENIARSLNITLPPSPDGAFVDRMNPVGVSPQRRPRRGPEVLQNADLAPHINGYGLAAPRTSPKERVYTIIATEIGQKWKHFARRLGVHEGQLDALETSHTNIADRVYRVLYDFEVNCDQRQWRTHLLDALVEARRKDLKKRASIIFDTHAV